MKTFYDKLGAFPPVVCRLLARTVEGNGSVRPLSDVEISAAGRYNPMEVRALSWKASWDSVPAGEIKRFTEACGILLEDRTNLRKHTAYMKRNPSFAYLRRSPLWNAYLRELAESYLNSRA